jgi:hypothetical protein
MPWPRLKDFGIVDNPLIYSPFEENNAPDSGGGPPAFNDFLLLNSFPFLLLNGNNLTLLGAV